MEQADSLVRGAEQKNYNEYEKETARRIGEAVLKSHSDEKQIEAIVSGEPLAEDISFSALLFGPGDIDADDEQTIEDFGDDNERKAVEAIRSLIWSNFLDAGRKQVSLRKQVSDLQLALEIDEEETRRKGHSLSTRTIVTDYYHNQIRQLQEQQEGLANETPESYTLVRGLQLRKYAEQIQSREMVTTPYVKEHLERVEGDIAEGRPAFLHGHLGSGKTELAISAAKNASIHKAAMEEAKVDLIRYVRDNPESSAADRRAELGRYYRQHQAAFRDAFFEGDASAYERFSPLIISGSKDLTSQDLFVEKSLKLTKFNGKSIQEHVDDIDAEMAKWQVEHPEEARDPEKASKAADKILEVYKLKNQAFGTEVETISQAVCRGLEEGRPVIIDEVNAIPTAVLISLNDVMQKRPGQSCYVPGKGTVKIKPGFSIVMTGNLSSGSIDYSGTEDLNPAFLSRLDVIEHDYLPMSETDRSYIEQIDSNGNELFQVMIAYLTDRQGNLQLPNMDKSLEKIFSLCQLAHETQLVFENKWRESNMLSGSSGDMVEPRLEKSVLSIRNVMNVLREWNKGSEKDFDKALWDGFIAGISNGDDRNFILAMAKKHNFFSEQDGWQIELRERGSGLISLKEAHPGPFNYQSSPYETYSVRKVVEVLYGPGPEREIYPDIDFDKLEDMTNDEVDPKELAEYEAQLREIDDSIKALEILGQQCGCSLIDSDTEEVSARLHDDGGWGGGWG